MESELDKALRLASLLLPPAQADALRLAVKAETDNFNAVLERTWASQRDLAAARDAATAALAESEARRAEAEEGLACLEQTRRHLLKEHERQAERAQAAESSLAAAVEVLRTLEWGGWRSDTGAPICTCCASPEPTHAEDCALAAALATGGGASRASRERSGR